MTRLRRQLRIIVNTANHQSLNALAVWLNSVGRYLVGATGNYFSNTGVGMVSR